MRWFNLSKSFYLLSVISVIGFVPLPSTNGANILGVFTSHSPSHFIVHMTIAKSLAEAGHNVTVVSTLKPKVTHPAIHHVVIPLTAEKESEIHSSMDKMVGKKASLLSTIWHIFTSMHSMISLQSDALESAQFKRLYDQKFDLMILGYFMNDFQLGVAAKFKCPVILSWTGPPSGMLEEYIGSPKEISYVPLMNVAVKPGERMNLMQRIRNFFTAGLLDVFKFTLNYYFKGYYSKLFDAENNFPTLSEMKKNVSLVFCNSHFSEGPVRPNAPALVEIGGIQIKDKPDPLPQDIAEHLEAAKEHGAILFSLGSNLQGSHIKPESVQVIYKTLASLKQKVIWKWEDLDNVPGKSPNILYKKWLPQDDILAHPNLKLFITHAGKGGVAEAQYHGVPMLALPVFADQPGNADKLALADYGLHLDIYSLTENEFRSAVLEIIQNPKYSNNVKRFSQLYRDRPLTAKQSAVYWTEYILRHHGAQHMQSPLKHLNWFQSLSLDVISVILLSVYVFIKTVKIIFRLILKKIRTNKQSKTDKAKKQKIKKNK